MKATTTTLALMLAAATVATACAPADSDSTGTGGKTTSTGSGGAPGSGGGSGGMSTSSGGAPGSGGASTGSGGAPGSGGASSGGAPGSGGATATGGALGTGGRATGGAGGISATGGAGGSAIGSGGRGGTSVATGGAGGAKPATGGMTGTGGAPGTGGASGATTCNKTGSATSTTPTIWVIGDSTASIYTSDLYPRTGWAQPMPGYYAAACATVQDKALSGRSSKSFYDEGAWTPVKNALKAGDWVLIQFGHNDEKDDDPARYTIPGTTYKMYLSIYLDDTIAKGATPVLLTSINRNNWSGGKVSDSHGAYPPAVRELAAARKVALVDATALTKTYFERIGQAETNKLFMNLTAGQFPNYPDGNSDNTHLQEVGANAILKLTLADLARQSLAPGLLTKQVPVAP